MNEQTKPQAVDVLAVMRSRANRTDNNGLAVTDETLLDACAAVAELVGAGMALAAAMDAPDDKPFCLAATRNFNEADARFRAALARIGGQP